MTGRDATAGNAWEADRTPPPDEMNLPDIMTTFSGYNITTGTDWAAKRRPEILNAFQANVYGRVPKQDYQVKFSVDNIDEDALEGKAIGKSVTVMLSANGKSHNFNLYLLVPKSDKGPYPTFLGLNFYGNHTVHADSDIPISSSWTPNNSQFCVFDHQADEVSRGVRAYRWPAERIIQRGYALAVVYSGDIDPDFDDGFTNGVHALFSGERDNQSWGTIGAWAWGLSRAMDYLMQDEDVDRNKVAVMGHSRLGKAALWAGAQDERFALVISNDSGCGGAAISRRKSGERLKDINGNFPHWFARSFRQYNGKEETLPVDQHMLMSLVAPRPLYVASAQQDDWADPYGEYLSLYFAQPAYRLLGYRTRLGLQHPKVNEPVSSGQLGYHIRSGRHDVTRYDWERYMDFADLHFHAEK
ncbi:acetylxylan esterase [Flavilitoribacter nigricans DSM 23189 = NBRC 102662]|uniref:Acetylxylan esterase n=2 Tax=Flavilitoribacter TaxID=2762562 RepID=A0A2D0NCL4_FLAN2|nr:acetylxylan esterase [Flavilitoribacter nigricans DSM 23189 = NBRC 102662]